MYKSLFLESIKNYNLFVKSDQEFKKIVFYSEGKKYDHFYLPFIKSCLKNKLSFSYLSSDNQIPFETDNEKFKFYFIGKSFVRTYLFYMLECENLITTTPDIGNLFLKKSEKCKNMTFFHHSMCGLTTTLNENALTHYDTILCSNKKHFDELQTYKFSNPKAKLIKFGYPKIDEISKSNNFSLFNKTLKKILIAPTWGNEKEDFKIYKKLVEILIEKNLEVIFRPHPMTILHHKNSLIDLKKQFKDTYNFSISEKNNNLEDYLISNLIISDWSGSAIEFAIATNKPCIFLNTKRKIKNLNSSKEQKNNGFEFFFRKYLECEIEVEDISKIYEKIIKMRTNDEFLKKIKILKEDYLYNFNKTDEKIDNYLKSIYH